MLPIDFIALLRCPVSKAPLRLLEGDKAASLFADPVDAALSTHDGAFIYPVRGGILCLLPESATVRDGRAPQTDDGRVAAIKREVQQFYDKRGWKKRDAVFSDAVIFEDLRPVAAQYQHDCHLRVATHLAPDGAYFLDVASGPVQYDEYLIYSNGYRRRVCVDISFLALAEARERLGDKGVYILGDVTGLPFADDSFDGVVSLHTIYHVPEVKQEAAFKEIHRVLARDRKAVVVYSWGNRSLLMLATMLPIRAWQFLLRRLRRARAGGTRQELYAHQHSYRWFSSRQWPFTFELRCWRSVGVDFTKLYIHNWLFGRAILRGLYRLEDRWPRLFGIIGQYPMIVIGKLAASAAHTTDADLARDDYGGAHRAKLVDAQT
jgi:ubiquinone/menaquinone biosynthesis C-methylase UbiE/uncharacterized protein YbaR (Trm112 family)